MVLPSKDEFELLNNFAHDLKNPLSAVKSYVELIEHAGELNAQQRQFYKSALGGLERVEQIINELLDFARMEADSSLHFDVVDVLETAEGAVQMLENVAEEKRVKIFVMISPALQYVYADPRLLKHVFSNLLSNSIKYNRRDGEVHISAEAAGDFIRYRVMDTGIGIPKQQLHRIFERFYRVEHHSHKRIEGTGLGLTIVRSIIERHGGEIAVKSTLDEGTIFSFTLPRASLTATDADREALDDIDDSMQEAREQIEDSDSYDDYHG